MVWKKNTTPNIETIELKGRPVVHRKKYKKNGKTVEIFEPEEEEIKVDLLDPDPKSVEKTLKKLGLKK